MTVTVDLFNHAKSGKAEGRVWATDAATFVEIPEAPRVLADSQHFLVYSMKKRVTLRVVHRSNLVKGTVRVHSMPITSVRFVNYRSNVAASAAENEFFVWVVTDDSNGESAETARLTVKVYFKLQNPVTIRSFSFFINAENRRPDLLLLYEKQAAILDSSALIARFESDRLEATLEHNSTPLRPLTSTEERCLCSVGSGGWFAFTTELTMVAACTLQNRATPSWACCEGAAVYALHLLDTHTPTEESTILLAASTSAVFQWTLTGVAEPSLTRKFVLSGSIVVMESSRDTFAVFDDQRQLAVVTMESPSKFNCTHYPIPCQVRHGGVCFNRVSEGCCVLVDKSDRLTVFHLKGSPPSGEAHRAGETGKYTAISEAAKSTSSYTSLPAATTNAGGPGTIPPVGATPLPAAAAPTSTTAGPRTGSSIIANLVNQLGIQVPPRSGAYTHGANSSRPVTAGLTATPNATPAMTPTAAAAVSQTPLAVATNRPSHAPPTAASRPALHNASLPQTPIDGFLAAAMHLSEEEVRQSLERLQSAMANTAQVLQLVPDTLRRDHEQLLNLSLEAQMTELQQSLRQASQVTGLAPSGVASAAFDTYVLMCTMTPLTANLANGITRGVEEALTLHLDHEVRHAIGNRVRGTQKQILRARLDDALKESTAHFTAQVEASVQSILKRELVEALAGVNHTVMQLVQMNAQLQSKLDAITSCGLLEELRQAREEIRAWRANAQTQTNPPNPNPAFVGKRPSPETVRSTVQSLLNEGRYRHGLEYLVMAGHAPLTAQLLTSLGAEGAGVYDTLIEDVSVPDVVWCEALAQMAEAPPTAAADTEVAVSIIMDVLSEREKLLQGNARGRKLAEGLREFARRAHSNVTSSTGLQSLKSLEKRLQ